jgi:CheY-like chemotaxis protein
VIPAGTRVLVVEDEALIAVLLEDGLAKAASLQIDVAILDMNLAGKLSYPIGEVLAARNIPFIFATGYGASALPEALAGTPVLAKPFEPARLEQVLRAVLPQREAE